MNSPITILTSFFFMTLACNPSYTPPAYQTFDEYPVYEGTDLGLSYAAQQSVFRVWAPSASSLLLHLYESPVGGTPLESIAMKPSEQGTWLAEVKKDLLGKYYSFQATIEGQQMAEVVDPYAKAVGTNGLRGHIIAMEATHPKSWQTDQSPPLQSPNDIIVYELHVRDLSTHPSSGIQHRGKFLGLTEKGTRSPQGLSTGLDHLVDMGITHLHLLPSYDYLSVDESKLEDNIFNWGYDPQNYNVPEGSYSTNPADGAVRIREFKQMVKTLHDNGIRVVMDVVYNHTGATEASLFNHLVPGYYYRQNAAGGFSDASACGNEIASERPMVRKFILESVLHWVKEYHIDGFRFDLMGIHDIETMNQISEALHAIDPSIFIYGEGWTAGSSPLPDEQRALKANTMQLRQIAAFSDDIRDAIKGHVFTPTEKGFVSGKGGLKESIKFGIVASTEHPQVPYDSVNYSKAPWAKAPAQTMTYASCHDNHTLWDRLAISNPDADEATRIKMHQLALSIVLTSQGVSFLHAGTEMLRTKGGAENSFNQPDSINQINWERKAEYLPVVFFVQQLIQFRKAHPAFRLNTTEQIQQHLRFLDTPNDQLVAYTLSDHANGDPWKNILVAFNGLSAEQTLDLPEGEWQIALMGQQFYGPGNGRTVSGKINIPAIGALVLYQN
ncbi:MAG TPA: type I pullulanase [Saprospiraceae bacterium]|nr:type I pullulanase [Saprospiraceae bacterium]HMQ84210.1 type I pullulanase [Saprospiraceae bacterium]